MRLKRIVYRFLMCVLTLAFLTSDLRVYAQGMMQLPSPGTRLTLSPTYVPSLLKGIKVYRDDPFRFDFILDQGDDKVTDERVKIDSMRLIKYFLASITVPEKDLWVNLSPYEKDRIVPDAFGQTEMGRDLLAQDYILKQITASLMYPEGAVGKRFWAKIYAEAARRYGTTDIPVDTFNKVWIVPEKAVVYETPNAAYVVESRLKVMLESDYKAIAENESFARRGGSVTRPILSDTPTEGIAPLSPAPAIAWGNGRGQDIAKQILREIIIPILEKEINEGQNFTQLRQVYNSLILAIWFKDKIKASIFGQAYVDQDKIAGVNIDDKAAKDKIWAQYVDSFKKGAYNLIREEKDVVSGELIPRKYFSGGKDFSQIRKKLSRKGNKTALSQVVPDNSMLIKTSFNLSDESQNINQEGWDVHELNAAVHVKEVKAGLLAVIWDVDIQKYQPYVVVDEGLEGKFWLDRETNTLYDREGKKITFDEQRLMVAYVEKESHLKKSLLQRFKEVHPDLEVVGITGNENIFYNKPVVTVVRDVDGGYRFYHALNSALKEGHNYPMYVVDANGSASIEPYVRFQFNEDRRPAEIYINGELEDIRWATGIQLIMDGGEFISPSDANGLVEMYDDPKHIFVMPKIPIPGYMSGGVFFMADQFVRNPERISRYFENPDKPQDFFLSYSITDVDGKKKEVGISSEALRPLLEGVGYHEFTFWQDNHGRGIVTIRLRLKENGYPWHIIAETKDHRIKEIVMRGDGGGYGSRGATIREVAEWLKSENVFRAGIIDQGLTVRLTVGVKTFIAQKVDPQEGMQRASSIIIYAQSREKDDQKIISHGMKDNDNLNSGGIDFSGKIKQVQINSTKSNSYYFFASDIIQQLRIAGGITPVIMDIQPMTVSVAAFME